MQPSAQVSMLSGASSLVRHQCTILPKYQCSQRPHPWLDASAAVCPSIDALRSLVPGKTPVHPSAQVTMLSEASSLVRHKCTRLPKYRCSSLVRCQCSRLPNYRCFQRPHLWLDTIAPVFPSIAICLPSRPHFLLSHNLLELPHR